MDNWSWNFDPTYRNYNWVVVSNIFYFHPYLARWSNLTNIFQMGWNHHLDNIVFVLVGDLFTNFDLIGFITVKETNHLGVSLFALIFSNHQTSKASLN